VGYYGKLPEKAWDETAIFFKIRASTLKRISEVIADSLLLILLI
jgi:hypothetical protein